VGRDRLAVLTIGLTLLAACSSGGPSCGNATDPASTSFRCGTALTFDGHLYVQYDLKVEPPHVEEVGDGVFVACANGCTTEATAQAGGFGTDLYRYRDVDPSVAVVGTREDARRYTLYIRHGTSPRVVRAVLDGAPTLGP
jgi:hypothetical protein